MKKQIIEIPRSAWRSFAALALVLGVTYPACGWDKNSADEAWNGFNAKFLHTFSGGAQGFDLQEIDGSGTTGSFWEDAEEIEVAEDAYYWAGANGFDNSSEKTEIDNLCQGFVNNYGVKWTGSSSQDDQFNDDMLWATIAFTRAYQITHKQQWLTDAENGFNVVWGRARIKGDALDNGLGQYQDGNNVPQNPDSPVNYTCVIAGYLLSNNTGDSSYQNDADNVYTWAVGKGNLYHSSSGKVPDSTTGPTDYAYNYGIAIHAAALESDNTTCENMATYLVYGFGGGNYPYNGITDFDNTAWNVLPNYAHNSGTGATDRGGNDVGYDGICLRGVGFAISKGLLSSDIKEWAQGNVNQANSIANADYLMWTDWQAATEASDNYSWNCSSALSGMLNIPAP